MGIRLGEIKCISLPLFLLLVFRNTRRDYNWVLVSWVCPSEGVVTDPGRKKAATGERRTPVTHPIEPGKPAQSSFVVEDSKQRSGSPGVLTLSFFALKSCQNPARHILSSLMDSRSLSRLARCIMRMERSDDAGIESKDFGTHAIGTRRREQKSSTQLPSGRSSCRTVPRNFQRTGRGGGCLI